MNLDDRDLARLLGLTRVALGVASFLAPRRFARMWSGERSEETVAVLAVRGLGARDVAIGVGILVALEHGSPVRGWLEASALSDAADASGTVLAWRRLSWWRATGLVALEAGAAALGMRLAASLSD